MFDYLIRVSRIKIICHFIGNCFKLTVSLFSYFRSCFWFNTHSQLLHLVVKCLILNACGFCSTELGKVLPIRCKIRRMMVGERGVQGGGTHKYKRSQLFTIQVTTILQAGTVVFSASVKG